MTFENAVNEIKSMFPERTFFSFGFEYNINHNGEPSYMCKACAIPQWEGSSKNMKTISYWKPTWEGVITAFKIHLLPNGEGSLEEAPKELAI